MISPTAEDTLAARDRLPAAPAAGSFSDPVFVLCNGRSGSTLLRFVLDAHPDLACPPETNLPGLCAQLATVWSLIVGAPLSADRGDEPPEIPQAALGGVRDTMDRLIGSYLARRGKKRYCDKSLGAARYAELLLKVYPQARFICLYRHPMDVIASGVEACPWGLNGYGFDPYIAATPGNAVMALASFWADNVRAALAVEERFPGTCFRLRYEDLVADTEATAAALFSFLDAPAVAGISRSCFSAERERFGPADYKIWHTSGITADSVGRGWSVPAAMIAPQLVGVMNDLAGKLGYLLIDGRWGTTEPPADPRAVITVPPAPAGADRYATPQATGPAAGGRTAGTLAVRGERLRSQRLGRALHAGVMALSGGGAIQQWGGFGGETFIAIAITRDAAQPAEYWLVDLCGATVTLAGKQAQERSDWDVIGTVDAWEKVIDGKANLSVALRSCQLRYCDNGETAPLAADTRIRILSQLLGQANWPVR